MTRRIKRRHTNQHRREAIPVPSTKKLTTYSHKSYEVEVRNNEKLPRFPHEGSRQVKKEKHII